MRPADRSLPPRNNDKQQPDDRYAGAVINPSGLADHEARRRIGKVTRALPDKDKPHDQKNHPDDRQQCLHLPSPLAESETAQRFILPREAGKGAKAAFFGRRTLKNATRKRRYGVSTVEGATAAPLALTPQAPSTAPR